MEATPSFNGLVDRVLTSGVVTDPNWRSAFDLVKQWSKEAEAKAKKWKALTITFVVLVLVLLIIIAATTGQTARNVKANHITPPEDTTVVTN